MDKLSYKTLFLILVLLLIPIVLLLRIRQKPVATLAAWWNDSWMYRTAINISTHNVGETNVYIVASVNIGSTAKSQTDDGDFRFTDQSGNLLPYYIVSGAGTTNISFHINFTSFPAGAQTIYAYYGNPSVDNGFSATDFATEASNYSLGANAAEETGGGPIAWWKFDEGVGTSAADSSVNSNKLVFAAGTSAPAWVGQDQCISGKCLKFTNGLRTIAQTSGNIPTMSEYTLSTWYRGDSSLLPAGQNIYVLGWDSYISLTIQASRTGLLVRNAADNNYYYLGPSTNTLDNKWHQLVATIDVGATSAKIYIDGNLSVATTIPDQWTGSRKINVGSWASNYGNFTGYLDEPKLYSYARTAAQVKQDYTSGLSGQSSGSGNAANIGSVSSKSLSDGLVGYWKFDNGVGTSTADFSGGTSVVTLGPGDSSPGWAAGNFGTGLSFPGTQTYADGDVANMPTSGNLTVSFWAYHPNVSSGAAVSFMTGATADTYLNIFPMYAGTINLSSAWKSWTFDDTGVATPSNTWGHYVFVLDSQNQTMYFNGSPIWSSARTAGPPTQPTKIRFGNRYYTNSAFNGIVDEVRVYNRALSANEIKQLYRYAPGPIGYWKFEEGAGTTAFDSSGNNYNLAWAGPSNHYTIGRYGKSAQLINSADNANGAYSALDMGLQSWTIASWIKTSTQSRNYIIDKGAGAGSDGFRFETGTDFKLLAIIGTSAAFTQVTGSKAINDGIWHHVAVTFNRTSTAQIYVDGVPSGNAVDITPRLGLQSSSTANFFIGSFSSSLRFNGQLDDVKIYNYARTPSQINEDMNASAGDKQPLAWYKFDEGQGAVANNSGSVGSTINGTFGAGDSAPSWTDGRMNKGLSFNGSSSYLQIPPSTVFSNMSDESVSLWVKPAGVGYIIFQNNGWSRRIYYNGSTFNFNFYDVGSTLYNVVTQGPALAANQWYHLAYTYTSATKTINAYVNGTLNKTAVLNQALMTANSHWWLGRACAGSNCDNYINARIDDFKIYNYPLTDDEVKIDFNRGSSVQMGQTNQTIGATTTSLDYCVPGDTSYCASPVGEWKFEEGAGTTAFDSSGNNRHGTVVNGSYTNGKVGKAVSFNGTSSTINLGPLTSLQNAGTIDFWFRYDPSQSTVNYERLISAADDTNNEFRILLDNSSPRKLYWIHKKNNITTNYLLTNFNSNLWHHLTYTSDIGTSTSKMYLDGLNIFSVSTNVQPFNLSANWYLGSQSGANSWFPGQIDQVRIYDYARTPAQAAWDYNQGSPVAWWKFDECQGGTAFDSSGLGYSGTISIGASGTQNTLGTCQAGTSAAWTAGAAGKINSSLSFDGMDDHVYSNSAVGFSGLRSGSIAFWTYPKGRGSYSGNNQEGKFQLGVSRPLIYGTGSITIHWNGASNQYPVSTPLSDNVWTHVTVAWQNAGSGNADGVIYIYKNGKLTNTVSNLTLPVNNLNSFDIGSYGGQSPYNGLLDDIRLYSYPLTAAQVKTVYANGAATFGQ